MDLFYASKQNHITSSIDNAMVCTSVTRGCPQGEVLFSLLWCLVMDELMFTLNEDGTYAQGYADDLVIVISGKFPNTIRELMQRALLRVERWCHKNGLSVNPEKTEVVPFTRRRNVGLQGITLLNSELKLSQIS